MADNSILPHSLDDYFKSTPIGSINRAIGNNLFGINHQQIPNAVPSNKDIYGLTFFVRPQLNMQSDNLRNLRIFSPLLTTDYYTIQQFVRCTLDPRQQTGYRIKSAVPAVNCPVVDEHQAFIPILTNNINSISGWPDVVAPTFSSTPGLYNEGWSIVDGITKNYEVFSMDVSFRNTKGDPVLYMFYVWLHYQAAVFEGKLVPYLDFLSENEIDYNSRIYRLVLDKQKQKVTKIAATGACFPISIPTGSFFDYTNDKPFNDQNKDITVRFQCMGVDYLDDITIREFNQTVVNFNPSMADNARDREMMKVPQSLLGMFNNRGYPRINTLNYNLEWWVSSNFFDTRTAEFLKTNLASSAVQDMFNTGD